MREEEQIVKGYDPEIMRRLLSFARPYIVPVILAVVALIVSTTGELLMPVILQRAIDQDLTISYWRVLQPSVITEEGNERFAEDAVRVGERLFLPDATLNEVSGRQKDALRSQGVIEDSRYYVLPVDSDAKRRLIADNPEVFLRGDERAALLLSDFTEFNDQEKEVLKAHDFAGLRVKTRLFLVTLLSVLVFTFLQVYLMALTGQGIMKDLRLRLFDHMIHQSLQYLSTNPVGKIVTRVTNDVETINELFTSVLINLLKDLSLMLGVIVSLYFLNVRLAIVTTLTLPPVIIIGVVFRKYARNAYRRIRYWVSQVNAFLSEHLSGMSVVQLFVQENRIDREFDDRNSELLQANLTQMYVFAVFRPAVDLFSSVSIAFIIYFGASYYLDGIVSLGVLIVFINLIRKFYRPVMEIAERYNILQSAMAGGERVFQLLDEEVRIPDHGKIALDKEAARGRVDFNDVHFAYKKDEPVLRGVDFTVMPGETIAIVGYTGAGKTTVANLLTRLWDIDSGTIRLDGTDIRDLPLGDIRHAVQPIQQDVFLFSATIRENITLGEEMSDNHIMEACRAVRADSFIERLPKGLDTPLNERGTNLSTGQRQLLSFARVLAHNPRVIIMDEATANIDTETERLVQKGVEVLMQNRTALVIAHRLSTIKRADRILVLSAGRVLEEGNHDELIKQKGVYYNLYRLQYTAE
jgi:ATP-binding cassette subfamily B protein